MTYILGWRNEIGAFLFADSAITFPTSEPIDDRRHSTFGELRHVSRDEVVTESALKLLNFGNIAVAFSGNVHLCYSIAARMRALIVTGAPPREAFGDAIRALYPIAAVMDDPRRGAGLLAAIPEAPSGTLLAFDGNPTNLEVREARIGQAAHFGSLQLDLKRSMNLLLSSVDHYMSGDAKRFAVCALGGLQSLGVRHYLLEQGVGGAFAGLYADAIGIHWQPDILFAVSSHLAPRNQKGFRQAGFVASAVRGNVHFARSTFSDDITIFGSPLTLPSTEVAYNAAEKEARNILIDGRFDYVVALDSHAAVISVFEMQREKETEQIKVGVYVDEIDDNVACEVVLDADSTKQYFERLKTVQEGGNGRFALAYQPYRPAGCKWANWRPRVSPRLRR